MKKSPTPIAVFRIRPRRNQSLALQVEVYANIRSLRSSLIHEDKIHGLRRVSTKGLVGCVTGVIERCKGRKTGLFAIMRLSKTNLTMATLTHEAFHATMRWAERVNIQYVPTGSGGGNKPSSSTEERLATVHDSICRMMVHELTKAGLLP